jgi:hypothetical protein
MCASLSTYPIAAKFVAFTLKATGSAVEGVSLLIYAAAIAAVRRQRVVACTDKAAFSTVLFVRRCIGAPFATLGLPGGAPRF